MLAKVWMMAVGIKSAAGSYWCGGKILFDFSVQRWTPPESEAKCRILSFLCSSGGVLKMAATPPC
jgi:hypothetical protein